MTTATIISRRGRLGIDAHIDGKRYTMDTIHTPGRREHLQSTCDRIVAGDPDLLAAIRKSADDTATYHETGAQVRTAWARHAV